MSFIGEAAFSAFLEVLLDKLISAGLNFVADHKQVHEQLKVWQSELPFIQAVLSDAEEKQIKNQHVKIWLADLQNLAYDMDDILDEFAYEDLRLKLEKTQAEASTSKVLKFIPTCCTTSDFSPNSVMFIHKMIPKMKDITTSLNDLTRRRSRLDLSTEIMSEGAASKGNKPRLQPTSVMDEAVKYVGRENEKREILELLKSCKIDSEGGTSVISILGMGGMGKTTLAELVYNDDGIKNSFDYKAWVCVSDDFDAINITKTILRSIDPSSCDDNDLNLLQVKLKDKLSGKKLLLVLDDIWNESYEDWTILRSPFGVGAKIIVTTRNQNVSSNVVTMKAFHLDELSQDDCLFIFTQHALRARDFNGHPELKEVGVKIVRRCNGLPLAAKAIGGLLRTVRDPGAWEKIYESEIWDLPQYQCGIIPALRLSYYHLPSHLKRCFAYCSILPKDYEFKKEEIILLWRAEGLLEQNVKIQIKDFESQCFQDLVSRSFFQISSKDKSRFVMHDLINDLAQLVAGEICSKAEGDKQLRISTCTRHSSYVKSRYDGKKKFDAFDKANSLRTFLPLELLWEREFYLTSSVLDDLLPKMKCLRVLSLKGYHISELSDCFENLKHLRYLDFSKTSIRCLPDSLCSLYHLETLILSQCRRLEKLPSKLGNLMELQYLDIGGPNSIEGMPSGVGKLTKLERLSDFILGKGDGHLVQELKNLSNLRGDFCFSGLENVKDQDAREAVLNEKLGIDRLTLQWRTTFDTRIKEEEERVLDFLCPQKKLEHLAIEGYDGAKFSAWIADSSLKNLLCLRLQNCKNCKSLPSIGRLPLLKDLGIEGFNEVNKVGVEFFGENQSNVFVSLERLWFSDMPNWNEWDPCEGDEQVFKFPNLLELTIKNCPQLSGRLPARLHSLQKLRIYECNLLVISISSFPSLCELDIDGCDELADRCSEEATSLQTVRLSNISKFSIPPERTMSRFTNLESFEISGWQEMASLSQYGFGLLGHRDITIANFPQLVSLETEEVVEEKLQLGKQSKGIESLTIRGCERLNRLSEVLHSLQFITYMIITGCPSLFCFARNNLPPTLKRLEIGACKTLDYLVDESGKKSNTCFLEDLEIWDCPSLIRLSSRGDLANGLRRLHIDRCLKLTCLFSNAKLPLMLKELYIRSCPELECIAHDFHETTILESIRIKDCYNIKSLPGGLDKLNHLREIFISSCSNLVPFEESGLPPTANLSVLSFSDCGNFGAFLKCINNFTSLRRLTVSSCSIDISFPEEGFPTNLTFLHISRAPKICRALVEWGLDRLTSLQELYISGEGFSDLVSFPKKEMMLPASLTLITIKNFKNLKYIEAFQNLTFLQFLLIFDCPKLTALPEKDTLLPLLMLDIRSCPRLKENCKRGKGREWSKIAHIPVVKIDGEYIIPRGLKEFYP